MTKQIQKGFTLIELMIVVAIIGILAAIAIPQYGNYIARSQMSEAVSLMAGMKTPIEEYINTNGEFPEGATKLSALGVLAAGTYVSGIVSADLGTASEGGTLTATMKTAPAVNTRITGGTLSMHRSTGGVWNCVRGISGTAVTDVYIPGSCQQDASSS